MSRAETTLRSLSGTTNGCGNPEQGEAAGKKNLLTAELSP